MAELDATRPAALARERTRAVPAWLWLSGLVVASAAFRYVLTRRTIAPWIMVDEVIYSELARSFAASGHFLIREEPAGGAYGVVYPILLSPAYRIFESLPNAYAAAKAINALLMSLAAVPAYALASRVLSPRAALVAAGLTVAVPSMAYTGTIMTENAFYGLFLCAALALVAYLERPTWPRVVLVLGLCGVAFATRAQAIALLPAVLTAPLLLTFVRRESPSRHRALFATVAALVGAAVLVEGARGRSPLALLGAYRSAGEAGYEPWPVLRSLAFHLSELDLYLCVLPVAAFVVLLAALRRLPSRAQVFVVATVALCGWLALEVAAFASRITPERVEERNLFYVAPLLLIALLLWIELGCPRPRPLAGAVALATGALPALLPYDRLIGVGAQSDTLALLPLWTLQDTVLTLGQVRWAVLAGGLALAAVFLLVPARLGLALPALVLALFAVALQPIAEGAHGVRRAAIGALFQGTTRTERDWIDRAVGRETQVDLLWRGTPGLAFAVWENEFFNRSVRRVLNLGPYNPGGLPETRVAVDRETGFLVTAGGRAPASAYLLSAEPVAGTTLARDAPKELRLVRAAGRPRLRFEVSGLYGDAWSGPRLTYTRFSCRGGTLSVLLDSDEKLFRRPQSVVATVGGRRAARASVFGQRRTSLRVPLAPEANRCVATFAVTPTRVPGPADPRRLGVHFRRFDFRPRAADAG